MEIEKEDVEWLIGIIIPILVDIYRDRKKKRKSKKHKRRKRK